MQFSGPPVGRPSIPSLSRGGYPVLELQGQWVKEIWDEVCQEADERVELTERMGSMIQKYGPHGHSSMKDGIRPLVEPTCKFKIGESDQNPTKSFGRISRYTRCFSTSLDFITRHVLLDTPNTKKRTGYAKNPIIMEAIRCIWFKTKVGRSVMLPEYFSPITLITLALIFTAIEFCIEEYSTGRFKQGIIDELLDKDRYETHLKDLTDWAALKPSASTAFLQRIHDQCRASIGAALVKKTGRMTEAARERALDGGDQDADDDDDDE
ncbi:hypothetical protein B0H13DRAFT_1881913 [Mycena leptocephala]|nr:hypothetical protein B0H13DRAFT_1881913 [Mycena leptocephala]